MKRRGLILILVLAALAAGSGLTLARLDDANRRALYIWVNDMGRSLGLGVRARDLAHLERMTGLPDVSNVRCRDCHGISVEKLPWNQPRPQHPAPEGLAMSPTGDRLYVAATDTDEVIELSPATRGVLRRVRVSGGPIGVAIDATGHRLYVTCRKADRVAVLDTATLAEVGEVPVGLGPVGVAFAQSPAGPRLVVANTGSDDVSLIDAAELKETRRLAAGREPYGVACTPDGLRALVACRLADMPGPDEVPHSELTVIDLERGRVIMRHALESAHLSEAVAVVAGRDWALTPLVRVRNLVPITQVARGWVMSGGIALTAPDGTGAVLQLPTDEANAFFADPAGLVVDAAGARAYLAAGGGDVVTVLDLERIAQWLGEAEPAVRQEAIHDLELAADYVVARIPTGRNPGQLVLSPDGRTLFVAERLDDAILMIDTATLEPAGRIRLAEGGNRDPIRRGKSVFTSAAKTFQSQFSCRSCHPDGHVDGLTYDFDGDGIGDNMLDNRSLQGLASTWPFKWNGKNPSLKVQCGPRFAKVLMRTDPFSEAELQDLTAFIESMPPARTQPAARRGQALTPPEQRGREIFFATHTPGGVEIPVERRCFTCHMPPLYTNRAKSAVGTRGRHDVTDEFDTPHLLGIAASAPYLHDGRAKTLEELWTVYQTNDLHGVSSYMNKHQLNDLVEFLKTL